MIFRKILISFGLLGMLCEPLHAQVACRFEQLSIQPLVADKADVFAGSAQQKEVRFVNLKEHGVVDAFPEAPLMIRDLQTGKQCEVDGGVWVRNAVYLGAQGRTLMTHEYSGSNAFLVFYDTATCRKKFEIEVSTSAWTIDSTQKGSTLTLADAADAKKTKVIAFNAQCLPILAHPSRRGS